jgi:glycosyltransferase involved in cell wall biosynthesis
MLLEAASYLQSELGLSVEVRIVGDGPDLPRLKQMADDLGVGASFLGSLYSDASLAEFYRSIHMTVIPGHAGLTVIQSLAHGRPVVTHDNPDKHAAEWEAITPETGRFFAEGDAASLAKAIRDLTTDIQADEGRVRVACRSAYQAGWHPDRNAELIRAAILERFSS